MSKFENPLNSVRIASPCQADWSEMYGDNRKRFCGDCKLNVYNLSGMTKDEAESLIQNAEGRLCVRFFQRQDGTILTADCPVGWAKIKQRTRLVITAVLSMLMTLFTGVLFASFFSKQRPIIGDLRIPFATPTPVQTMGEMAIRPNTNSANHAEAQAIIGDVAIRPRRREKEHAQRGN
jgi:hypothetical protein